MEYKFNDNNSLLRQYDENEILQLLNDDVKLVYVDTGLEEVVARYDDLPDIIVDFNNKLGFINLKIYSYDNLSEIPIATTNGCFLDRCDPVVRTDIISRLTKLQLGEEKIKDYKIIDEMMLEHIDNKRKSKDILEI